MREGRLHWIGLVRRWAEVGVVRWVGEMAVLGYRRLKDQGQLGEIQFGMIWSG